MCLPSFVFWKMGSIRETDATDASESNRQGVNPAATIYPPHDFSGRNSLKLLQTKNLMSCSKSRAVPTLYWVTSQLPVTFFFYEYKAKQRRFKKLYDQL